MLLDCQMPVMDGYAAVAALPRQEEEGGRVRAPVIGLTGNIMHGDREKCLAAGMDDYLSKPIELARLRVVLSRWSPEKVVGGNYIAVRKPDEPLKILQKMGAPRGWMKAPYRWNPGKFTPPWLPLSTFVCAEIVLNQREDTGVLIKQIRQCLDLFFLIVFAVEIKYTCLSIAGLSHAGSSWFYRFCLAIQP
jgi:CheY-like chemotaxis protein